MIVYLFIVGFWVGYLIILSFRVFNGLKERLRISRVRRDVNYEDFFVSFFRVR